MNPDNQSVRRDEEGYLLNPRDWTRELAAQLAREEQLELTDEHWIAIVFMREYQAAHGITPDVRHVTKHMAAILGCDKKAAKKRLFELFPYGYVKQTCKVAGMMRPRAWSTG